MDVDIKGNKISYDARKESLLLSVLAQNCPSQSKFVKKINDELYNIIDSIPQMNPEQVLILHWHSGYEFGHPNDYYSVGAIACKSIKPWKYHFVDHLIQHKNPFKKIIGAELLNQIKLDYNSKTALILEGNDSMYNYYLYTAEVEKHFKKIGFKCDYELKQRLLTQSNESSLESGLEAFFDRLCEDN